MPMYPMPILAVTVEHIDALVNTPVLEDRYLEYKESLPGDGDAIREFLADITSFANTSGGYMVFGIKEENREPKELVGIVGIQPDAEISRLENLLRDCVEPRLTGVDMRALRLTRGSNVLLLRVARSYALPHVVKRGSTWRFYGRNSNGKYPLDLAEVRALFMLSGEYASTARAWRSERVQTILNGHTPVPSTPGGKAVLHLLPLSALGVTTLLDATWMARQQDLLRPIGVYSWSPRINFEGFLTHAEVYPTGSTAAYTQLFRDGRLEAVSSFVIGDHHVSTDEIERSVREALGDYLRALGDLGVTPPMFIFLTLTGVMGHNLIAGYERQSHSLASGTIHKIDRDRLDVPEQYIEQVPIDVDAILRPIFDTVWNAAGWERAMSFDNSGRWLGGQ